MESDGGMEVDIHAQGGTAENAADSSNQEEDEEESDWSTFWTWYHFHNSFQALCSTNAKH